MQNHHQKKSQKLVSFIFNELALFVTFSQKFSISSLISLFISSKISIVFILFISIESILFATLFTTSKKQIFWAKIVSKAILSKLSRLLRFVFKFLSIILLSIFSQISISTKTYLTMNNLFVIFVERSKSLNLSHRQKNVNSSYHWRSSKLVIFYQTRITSYFLSSFNSFKSNVLLKSNLFLSIQINSTRRHINKSICKQMINFASQNASFFNDFKCFSHICRRCQQSFEFEN